MASGQDVKDLEHNQESEPLKRKRKRAPSSSQEPSADAPESEVTEASSNNKRKRKVWELWSKDETGFFFEALCEFGKDFLAILKYFEVKKKRFTKTKDQIKDFYYRTFHKLAKFVRFPKDTPRIAMELYSIINYSEIWKKLGVNNIDKRLGPVLNELVLKGISKTKVRGKFFKLKTPNCKALRKLNEKEIDNTASVSLPEKVWIELEPLNNESSWKVQNVAHNPLLKVCVPIDRPIRSVFKFLRKRWGSEKTVLRDKLSKQLGQPTRYDDILRFLPSKDAQIVIPTVKEADVVTSVNISFEHFHKRQKSNKDSSDPISSPGDQQILSPGADTEIVISEQFFDVPISFLNSGWPEGLDQSFFENDGGDVPLLDPTPDHESQDEDHPEKTNNYFEGLSSEEMIKRIQSGWSETECGDITVGHLFTYIGQGKRITLTYSFENLVVTEEENLNAMLRALLSVGKSLTQRTSRGKVSLEVGQCQCGHICPVSSSATLARDPQNSSHHVLEDDRTPPRKLGSIPRTRKNSPYADGMDAVKGNREDGVFKRPVIPFRRRVHKVLMDSSEFTENQVPSPSPVQNKTIRTARSRKPLQKLTPSFVIGSQSPSPLISLQNLVPIQITVGEHSTLPSSTHVANPSTPFVNFGRDLLERMQVTSVHNPGEMVIQSELSNISISDLLTSPIKVPTEDLLCSTSFFQTPPHTSQDDLETPSSSPLRETPSESPRRSVIKNLWGNARDGSGDSLSQDLFLGSAENSQMKASVSDLNELLLYLKTPVKEGGPKPPASISEDSINNILNQLQTPMKNNEGPPLNINIADLSDILTQLKTPVKLQASNSPPSEGILESGAPNYIPDVLAVKTPTKSQVVPSLLEIDFDDRGKPTQGATVHVGSVDTLPRPEGSINSPFVTEGAAMGAAVATEYLIPGFTNVEDGLRRSQEENASGLLFQQPPTPPESDIVSGASPLSLEPESPLKSLEFFEPELKNQTTGMDACDLNTPEKHPQALKGGIVLPFPEF